MLDHTFDGLAIDHICMSFCLCHSSEGHLHVVTFLVTTRHGDVGSKDRDGDTPLHVACM